MQDNHTSIGIVGAGMYLPKLFDGGGDCRAERDTEQVVREKLGINKNTCRAGRSSQPNGDLGAQDCLSKYDIKPEEIDVVLCTTEEWKEYLLWTAGIHLAHEIARPKPGRWIFTCAAAPPSPRSRRQKT
jgi:3-oxoacyl-[acyl-carrier-protein] synthase-3